jgi:uncharacterized damage-inducible protein DinB
MEQSLTYTLALLERTPRTLNALLRDLPDEWTLSNEGEKTWSAFDIVGHLIHCERVDWMPRARIILEHGESKPFEPLDREAQRLGSEGKSLDELLDEFARLRAQNLNELRVLNLDEKSMLLHGQHPAFGAVTLSQLLAAWAVHDMTHLHQLARVLAHQYAVAVGPWTRYLGVLRCAGSSDKA